jgi:pimeloyl-ACP methyl ester carboxylesterase
LLVSVLSLTAANLCAQQNDSPTSFVATSADGVSITYDTRGRGPIALVFVHGWSGARTDWRNQAEYFAANFATRYTVVTLDLAGHGTSGHGRTDQSIHAFGSDVKAVVEALHLQSMVLIGHNLGGDAILEAAQDLDDRVIGLVWVDSYRNLELLDERARVRVEKFLRKLNEEFASTTRALARGMFTADAKPPLVDSVIDRMAAAPTDIAIKSMKAALDYAFTVPRTLAVLKPPVVAFTPKAVTSESDCEVMWNKHRVTLKPINGRAFMMLETPETFNGMLREVIEQWTPSDLTLPVDFKTHDRLPIKPPDCHLQPAP